MKQTETCYVLLINRKFQNEVQQLLETLWLFIRLFQITFKEIQSARENQIASWRLLTLNASDFIQDTERRHSGIMRKFFSFK